jgi:death-on-curing protein
LTEHLDLEDLLVAADAAIGHPAEVRDVGILEAAVARTRATAFGEDAYPALEAKAAALFQSNVAGDPLLDGNKRLGWVAFRLFLCVNGMDVRPPGDSAFELVVAVADGSLRDVDAIAARVRPWLVELGDS